MNNCKHTQVGKTFKKSKSKNSGRPLNPCDLVGKLIAESTLGDINRSSKNEIKENYKLNDVEMLPTPIHVMRERREEDRKIREKMIKDIQWSNAAKATPEEMDEFEKTLPYSCTVFAVSDGNIPPDPFAKEY